MTMSGGLGGDPGALARETGEGNWVPPPHSRPKLGLLEG